MALASRAAALIAALAASSPDMALAQGPGLPNLSYAPTEALTIIGRIDKDSGAPRAHGTMAMHQGYLVIVFSRDSGEGDGGFAFFDISDPKQPKLINAKDDAETEDIREAHGFGFAKVGGKSYVALQASFGIQFWDWTDVMAPKLASYLKLPGITASDYGTGAWWSFWQGTHLFVGGSGNGLYVVDARDPTNPKLLERTDGGDNPVPPGQLGAFKTGPVFAVGNLLAITGMDQPGLATVDVRDPASPKLLAAKSVDTEKIYSGMLNGHRLYGAGTNGFLEVHDITDPTKIALVGKSEKFDGRGGYLTVQDGVVHMGASKRYFKIDATAPPPFPILGSASSEIDGRDEDFCTVLGNLGFISDDHGKGTSITPHQAAADTTPPAVNMVSPASGSVSQALTSRVGMTFTDSIDFDSVTDVTVIVRPVGGAPLPGIFSHQTGIVSFAPLSPLSPNTSYEILLPAGGVKDAAGNGIQTDWISQFSTGSAIDNPLCTITAPGPVAVMTEASFSVSTPATGALSFSWELGDGSPPVGPAASTSVSHNFAAPGHYTVIVKIFDAAGLVTACSIQQTVHRPVASGSPARSSTIALSTDGASLWTANPDSATISRLDLTASSIATEVAVGEEPRAVAIAPDGRVWAVSERAGTLSIVDGSAVTSTIDLGRGSRPNALVFAPDGGAAWVTLRGRGQLLELDPATGATRRSADVGPVPGGLAVSPDGASLLVTRFVSPKTHAEARFVDAATLTVTRTAELAEDPGPDTESSGRGVLNYLRSPSFSPDGARAYVPAKKDNTSRGWWRDNEKLTFESTVRASVAELPLVGAEDLSTRRDLNDRSLPSVVQPSKLGDYLFVATEGTNSVDVLDAYSGQLTTTIEKIGTAPDGLTLSADGKTLYVHAFLSREVRVFDVSSVVDFSAGQVKAVAVLPTVSSEPLSPEVLRGKQVFYDAMDRRMSRDHYLSCATCHLSGESDGRVWDFTDRGEGLRNTISLVGKAGTAQGFLHWSANFDEVQDFEHDIRGAFEGTGLMSDADFAQTDDTLGEPKAGKSDDLDALAAYVASLDRVYDSPHRNADGTLTAKARAGRRHFQDLGCGKCHGGANLTVSADANLMDVGTLTAASGLRLNDSLTGIDVPTLKGLYDTAPYLHDGSAETLDAVLEQAASTNLHGKLSRLSASQRAELSEYLLSLDETPVGDEEPVATGGCQCGAPGAPSSPRDTLWLLALSSAVLLRRCRRRP